MGEESFFGIPSSWQTWETCKKLGRKFVGSHHTSKNWQVTKIILIFGLRKSTLEQGQYNIILLSLAK